MTVGNREYIHPFVTTDTPHDTNVYHFRNIQGIQMEHG